jgi:hypothetical protein
METVVVDHQLVVDPQLRSVVGVEREAVASLMLNPDPGGVENAEPFEAVGNPRKAAVEGLGGDV